MVDLDAPRREERHLPGLHRHTSGQICVDSVAHFNIFHKLLGLCAFISQPLLVPNHVLHPCATEHSLPSPSHPSRPNHQGGYIFPASPCPTHETAAPMAMTSNSCASHVSLSQQVYT